MSVVLLQVPGWGNFNAMFEEGARQFQMSVGEERKTRNVDLSFHEWGREGFNFEGNLD